MVFQDRTHAGKLLAECLKKYKGQDVVVFALPRGGVVLGVEVAKVLLAPLSLVVPRKIGRPDNPEFAIGAVTETEEVVGGLELGMVDQDWLKEEVARQRLEARRRREVYLQGQDYINPNNKTCIIVDDELATGLTMRAAVGELKSAGAKEIVIAVPVGPADTVQELEKLDVRVVCLHIPKVFMGGVGYYYEDFSQVSDQQVVSLMQACV